jgi:hypothetical protein
MVTDWKRVAQEAWNALSWKAAAEQYHRDRTDPTGADSDNPWIRGHQTKRHKRLIQLERVLLGLIVHGPNVMHERDNAAFVRWARVHWQNAYKQIRTAEREEYWRRQSEAQRPKAHSIGCACWDCVLGLLADVARHQAEMAVRRHAQRRPLVPR